MNTTIVGWNCPKCLTFWHDTVMGGKSSIREVCPFDGTPRTEGRRIVLALGKDEDERQGADSHLPEDEQQEEI